MRIVSTIEARMTSTRLLGKSVKEIIGRPMLGLLVERIKHCKKIDQIVIATTDNPSDDIIEELAKKMSVGCFRGSEDDVLDRVLSAAKSFGADIILELWGDSPLMDSYILDNIVEYYLQNDFDCVGTTLPNFPKTFPLGLSALIFSTKILEDVDRITQNPVDRENVSNYIYEHSEIYEIAQLPCPPELNYPDIRLTVDEQKDFELIRIIFENFYPTNPNFSASDAIKFLNANPEIRDLNRDVMQRKLESWSKFDKK